MSAPTARRLGRRRQIEGAIRLAAPFLDVVLAVGEQVSRLAGRGQVQPDPPRRLRADPTRRRLGASSPADRD